MAKPKLTVIEGGLSRIYKKSVHDDALCFLDSGDIVDTQIDLLQSVDPSLYGRTVNGVTYGYPKDYMPDEFNQCVFLFAMFPNGNG